MQELLHARHLKYLPLPAARFQHQSQAQAFDAWCIFVEERQLSLQRLEAALAHWNRASLTAAWAAWQEHVAAMQQQREVAARAMQHFLNRTLAGAFRQWREVAVRKAGNANKAKMCLQVTLARCRGAPMSVTDNRSLFGQPSL